MAMPANIFSSVSVPGNFLAPDDRVRTDLTIDYELGGIAIGDPSQGLQVQVWETRLNAGSIQVSIEDAESWTTVTSDTGITEISLAFDQNMRPAAAYVAAGVVKLYWYDANAAAFVTTTYAGASSPVVMLDDKRPMEIDLSDILLFYVRAGRVYHRRQRDRYSVEYDLAAMPSGTTRVRRAGMTDANRIQLELGN